MGKKGKQAKQQMSEYSNNQCFTFRLIQLTVEWDDLVVFEKRPNSMSGTPPNTFSKPIKGNKSEFYEESGEIFQDVS